MGNCCKCASSKRSKEEENEGEFTNLDGIDNKNNRKNKKEASKSKTDKSTKDAAPAQSEEVHFEYDEATQRLVPIIKKHRKRNTAATSTTKSDNNDDDAKSIASDGSKKSASAALKKKKAGKRVRVPGGASGSVPDNISDAGSRQTGDGGRDEESLVDCMSNASFDIPLDENTMMRFEDTRNNHNNNNSTTLIGSGTTPRQISKEEDKDEKDGGEDDEDDDNDDDEEEFTLDDLQELEEISRSEIYGAFMVAVQMLRFGMKRITPTVHYMLDSHHSHKSSMSAKDEQHQANKNSNDNVMYPASPGTDSASEFIPSTTTVIQMMKMKKKKVKNVKKIDEKNSNENKDDAKTKPVSDENKNGNDDDDDDAKKDTETSEDESEEEGEMPVPGGGIAHKPHRVQLLELDARSIAHDGGKVKSDFLESRWDFFNSSAGLSEVSARSLSQGKALYGFKCFTGENMAPDDIRLISPFSNLSSFPNEVEDNNVPHIDFTDKKHLKKYTIIISKAMYLVPGLLKEDVSPEYWASREYCEACIAQVSKFEDCPEPSTFRMHKILVRFIFSLVVQFKVTEITDPAVLRSLATIDGFVPCRALLYERTKRDKTKVDMTVKVKSVLLFQEVPGGLLVSNVAAVYNSSIPGIIAAIVNNFGGNGASETEEVASRTRKHVWNKIVQPRLDAQAAAATSGKKKQ